LAGFSSLTLDKISLLGIFDSSTSFTSLYFASQRVALLKVSQGELHFRLLGCSPLAALRQKLTFLSSASARNPQNPLSWIIGSSRFFISFCFFFEKASFQQTFRRDGFTSLCYVSPLPKSAKKKRLFQASSTSQERLVIMG